LKWLAVPIAFAECRSRRLGYRPITRTVVQHGDAGDEIASPTLKNGPLFGQKFSTFERCIQLYIHM